MSHAPQPPPAGPVAQAGFWHVYDAAYRAAFYELWGALTESRASSRAFEIAHFQPDESVLEVAVGTGVFFSRLAALGGLRHRVGLEPARAMLARARRRVSSSRSHRVALCQAEARHLPFTPATFDVVVNNYMLDLLSEDDILAALNEFRRVLKPPGRLVLLTMAHQNAVLEKVWMWFYARSPQLVGGCRPVELPKLLTAAGWRVNLCETISQSGFRSQLTLARPA